MKNRIMVSPSPFAGEQSLSRSAFINPESEISPFWGLFEGKNKAAKESTDTSSNTSSTDTGESKTGAGASIITGFFEAIGALAPIFPAIGIGSKSRIAETNATANVNAQLLNAQTQSALAKSKEKEKLYLIIGVVVFLIVAVAGVLYTRK